jgi:hypothetical protein
MSPAEKYAECICRERIQVFLTRRPHQMPATCQKRLGICSTYWFWCHAYIFLKAIFEANCAVCAVCAVCTVCAVSAVCIVCAVCAVCPVCAICAVTSICTINACYMHKN